MKRRDFFKNIGIIGAGAVIAPKVIVAALAEKPLVVPPIVAGEGLLAQINKKPMQHHFVTGSEGMKEIQNILSDYEKTGTLRYNSWYEDQLKFQRKRWIQNDIDTGLFGRRIK